jgi:hypothetical protein
VSVFFLLRYAHLLFRENLCWHDHESKASFSTRLRGNQRRKENNALPQAWRDDKEEIASVIEVYTVVELMWEE